MSATIGALIAHGIGKQKPGFSRALQKRLTKRLGKRGNGSDEIAFQEVYYGDVFQPKQDFYLEYAKKQRIDNKFMRGFVLDILADASMYGFPGREDAPSVYDRVHERVRDAIVALEGRVEHNAPVVVMGHSLGGHVMSNFIWDRQERWVEGDEDDNLAETDFQRLKTLASFITFGCNIPLFVTAADPYVPIQVPSPSGLLPAEWGTEKKWLNYYDPDDILGWPLTALAAADEDAADDEIAALMDPADRARFLGMVSDHTINVGWPVQSATPFSHIGYWKDKDFIKPVAAHLAALHEVVEGAG